MVADWHGCYDEGWKGIIVDETFVVIRESDVLLIFEKKTAGRPA